MKRLSAENGPKAIGAYSIATQVKDMIYTSGQLGMDPSTGSLVDETIESQTEQALKNIKAILEENGSSMNRIIKTTVLLKDISDFKAFNAVYAGFFEEGEYPSRTAFEVGALPLDARIEIEVIALTNEG